MNKIYCRNKIGLLHFQNTITQPAFTCSKSTTEKKKNVRKTFPVIFVILKNKFITEHLRVTAFSSFILNLFWFLSKELHYSGGLRFSMYI